MFIHESTYNKIKFLKNNGSESFLAWICTQIKASIFDQKEYVYFDGDEVTCIYFLKDGACGFVLPRYSNIQYIEVTIGSTFGIIDIIGNMLLDQKDDNDFTLEKHKRCQRQFTLMSQEKSEVLTLSIEQLIVMNKEFPEEYNQLFNFGVRRLKRAHAVKLEAIKFCKKHLCQSPLK